MAVSDESQSSDASDVAAAERARRLAKLDALRARGITPYPPTFDRDRTVGDVRSAFSGLAAGEETDTVVRLAGRVMLLRRHGGLQFADLKDQSGTIQLLASRADLGAEAFADVGTLDRGDWVGVAGTVVCSKRGELSVRISELRLLSKALRALPDKHRGLSDVDTRLRQRYLDLIVNPETRRTFDIRSATIAAVRRVLTERGFTEVETPVLDASAGGAAARPFVTHHNALDIEMYLRIALELPLKRLVVGGFERVFEIGRVFRNEGLDRRHNPEFTLLEAYQALGDYRDMMDLVETICSQAALAANGTTIIQLEGRDVDMAPPWRRVTMADLIAEHADGARMHPSMPIEEARAICDRYEIEHEEGWSAGRLMSEVYDERCEGQLVEPTFVYDYPREVSPLARTHRDDDALVERFEAVVGGRELANAYSELNDPVDQRGRFEAEAAAKAAGDDEAQDVDEDYIRALEYGLPPTGGLGIGLDRLVMLLANAAAIRDVILFPTMKPEFGEAATARPASAASFVPVTGAPPLPGGSAPAEPPMESAPAGSTAPAAPGASPHPGGSAPAGPPMESAPAGSTAPAHSTLPPPRAAQPSSPSTIAPRVLSWLTFLGGLMYLLPRIDGLDDRLGVLRRVLVPESDRVAGHVASVLVGLVLVLAAPQIARRKHRAWVLVLGSFTVAVVIHVLRGPHPLPALYGVAMVAALIWYRDAFRARSDPASLLELIWIVPVYFAGVLSFGLVSILLEHNRIDPTPTFGGIIQTTFGGLIGVSGPYTYRGRLFSDFFPAALLALGIAGLLLLLIVLFRVVRSGAGPSAEERERASTIVHAYGHDSLAYFALRPDKSYFFSQDGQALIAYTLVAGTALVAADPIGPPEAMQRVVDEFVGFCRSRAWGMAFLAVQESQLELYTCHGFRAVYMGDEAIIRCDTFSLAGGPMKAVREAVNKVARNHHFQLVREVDATPELRDQLNGIRDRWRGKAPERGFTMELGGGVRGENPDLLLAVAFDAEERPVGFLRLVPCFGAEPGYSLDLMQREPDSVNGVTEYLIAQAAIELGARGVKRLSMNFAAWGRLFDTDAKLSIPQRALRKLAEVLNPFFQIKSLRDFNAKFEPEWLARSIVVEDPGAMPKVGLLYASVEGFLRLPLVGRYLVPRVSAAPTR
ncbi:MAG: lysyl-tRNA synthetase [Conexibacter sp.]|nr:lysyl-tRNA synthetase [Conexibacter sp.]